MQRRTSALVCSAGPLGSGHPSTLSAALLLALALPACGGDGAADSGTGAEAGSECRGAECTADGGEDASNPATGGSGGTSANVGDGGTTVPRAPDELEVRLQVNGARVPCGSCSVLIAQAAGGKEPYTYEWSDDSLEGPGPHEVCPDEPTDYSVKVTDSSAVAAVEFDQPAMVAEASAELACVDDEDAWGGCSGAGQVEEQPNVEECDWTEIDPTTAALLGIQETRMATSFSSQALAEQEALVPGREYEISYDQLLLQLNLGEPVKVDIWGSNEPCGQDQHYGTLVLDGRWHQSLCVEVENDWKYTRIDIDTGNVLFYFDFVPPATTVCKGCSEE